jgi:TolB protein
MKWKTGFPTSRRMERRWCIYIGYPAGTPTHDPRNVAIKIKLVAIDHGKVGGGEKTLIEATGGQGTMNVNSWAPDSMRFAYVTYEALP